MSPSEEKLKAEESTHFPSPGSAEGEGPGEPWPLHFLAYFSVLFVQRFLRCNLSATSWVFFA